MQGIRGELDLQQCLPYVLQPTHEIGVLWRPQHVSPREELVKLLLSNHSIDRWTRCSTWFRVMVAVGRAQTAHLTPEVCAAIQVLL